MAFESSARTYDRRTIVLHWLTAILVVGLWSVGQTIDWFPKGAPRTFARSAHIIFGVCLLIIVITRIGWRSSGGRRLPPADRGGLAALARATHWVLYGLLLSTVLLGLTNALVRGDNILGLFTIPSIAPGDKALRESVENWHGLSANILVGVAAFHALAGLFHYFVQRDNVLGRMIPSTLK
ncbi:MAG: cytochrome b [Burkholderiaceae bacterium]